MMPSLGRGIDRIEAIGATGVHLARGGREVLRGATLAVQAGEAVSLLGANGAGKSSLMAVLAGELAASRADDGPYINAQPLASLPLARQARMRAMLPQRSALAFDLLVAEVVAMGAYPFPELMPDAVRALIAQALDRADAAHLAGRRYLELSGGEQQRVHLARVFVQVLAGRGDDTAGRYLLLDEPTSSLDPRHQHELLRAVIALARGERIGVLLILHDINLAALWSDRIALLEQGTIFACDTPERVLTPANLRRVFGMDVHVAPHPRHPGKPLVVFG
ncbi:heme ABC transporter ATP-binding protein [Paracandidimonas lactea]|uniref:heme ABC transporter ATP-binding protein n=1 Tax=Paracandidimonas lactea TaxID=2895524 RepID=UPI001EF0CB50|nr:heme ABC transporter ATP-binding protein [Paracandidimonas lactea]